MQKAAYSAGRSAVTRVEMTAGMKGSLGCYYLACCYLALMTDSNYSAAKWAYLRAAQMAVQTDVHSVDGLAASMVALTAASTAA